MGYRPYAYPKERDEWMIRLRCALMPRVMAPQHKIFARIISYRVGPLLDYGNLVGGAKPIPDCLIRLGYLKDDAPKWFECEYLQEKCKRDEARTVIELLNLEGGASDV